MESVSVCSCRCCMFVSCMHPVAVYCHVMPDIVADDISN